jgi:hypothetical protein
MKHSNIFFKGDGLHRSWPGDKKLEKKLRRACVMKE